MASTSRDISVLELVYNSGVEEWLQFTAEKHHFLPADVEHVRKTLLGLSDELNESECPDPEMVLSVARTDEDLRDKDLTVIAKLCDGYYLARTFNPGYGGVVFVVLHPNSLGQVFFKFSWSMRGYWSNFGFGRMGGCCPTGAYIRFGFSGNQERTRAFIVGPVEEPSFQPGGHMVPTTKVLSCKNWEVKNFEQLDPDHPGWPGTILFDPRTGYEDILTMLFFRGRNFIYSPTHYAGGTLIRYNMTSGRQLATLQGFVAGLVQYLDGGHQLAAVVLPTNPTPEEVDFPERVVICETNTLQVLLITGLETLIDVNPVFGCWQFIAMYSVCFSWISVVFWHKTSRTFRGPNRSDDQSLVLQSVVLTLKVNKGLTTVRTLKELCRNSVLYNINSKAINSLPLPKSLQKYLYGES